VCAVNDHSNCREPGDSQVAITVVPSTGDSLRIFEDVRRGIVTTEVDAAVNPNDNIDSGLTEHIAAIRGLGKRVVDDVIEIGRRLDECRDIVGHGHWLDWINAEFGWSDQTARNFVRVYELSRDLKFKTVLDLGLPLGALYRLAAPQAEAARKEIIERAEAGEKIVQADVIKAITRRKAPAPAAVTTNPTEPKDHNVGDSDDRHDDNHGDGDDRHDDNYGQGIINDQRPVANGAANSPISGAPDTTDPAAPAPATETAPITSAGTTDAQPTHEDPVAVAVAAVDRLSPTELRSFLDQISPGDKRAFEHHFGGSKSDNVFAEIAQNASECTALLVHPKQHTDDIHKKLARIRNLAGGKSLGKSNAQLDRDAFARGMRSPANSAVAVS
jgi:hypothetical protein